MNNATLPRTPMTIRLSALMAAMAVTLAMLSGIDTLALSEASGALAVQAASAAAA